MCFFRDPRMMGAILTSAAPTRTYNLSCQSRFVLYFLACLYLAVTTVWFFPLLHVPAKSLTGPPFSAAMVYNFLRAHRYVVILQHSPVARLTEFLGFSSHPGRCK